jgi:hypothetical protein
MSIVQFITRQNRTFKTEISRDTNYRPVVRIKGHKKAVTDPRSPAIPVYNHETESTLSEKVFSEANANAINLFIEGEIEKLLKERPTKLKKQK